MDKCFGVWTDLVGMRIEVGCTQLPGSPCQRQNELQNHQSHSSIFFFKNKEMVHSHAVVVRCLVSQRDQQRQLPVLTDLIMASPVETTVFAVSLSLNVILA